MLFGGYDMPAAVDAELSGQIWATGGSDGTVKLWDCRVKSSVNQSTLHANNQGKYSIITSYHVVSIIRLLTLTHNI
jgi:WD40 repeat protein